MRTIFIAIAIPALLVPTARAQEGDGRDWNQAYDPYVGGLGVTLGASAGSGLS